MFSMLTLCIKHIPNINQDYGIDTDLVSIPRYYILVSYRSQNYGIEPSLEQTLLFRWAWAVTEQNDRGEASHMTAAGWCSIFFSYQKFSASLVNEQNDSLKHIICLDDFLYSSHSRNRFSPELLRHVDIRISTRLAHINYNYKCWIKHQTMTNF